MASTFIPPNLGQLVTTKLDGPNYLVWLNKFSPILKTNDLMGFMDGSESCPSKFLLDVEGKPITTLTLEFQLWTKKD